MEGLALKLLPALRSVGEAKNLTGGGGGLRFQAFRASLILRLKGFRV